MLKIRIVLLLALLSSIAKAQNTHKVYFDSNWKICDASKATYYRTPDVKDENGYLAQYFLISNNSKVSRGYHQTNTDIRRGRWEFYYSNGKLKNYETYMSGELTGPFCYYDSLSGFKQSEGAYVKGKAQGRLSFYYENSNKLNYTQEFVNDVGKGAYVLYDLATGNIVEKGIIENEKKNGKWEFYKANTKQLLSVCEFRNDVAHGLEVHYDDVTGLKAMEGQKLNGKDEGTWKFYNGLGKIDFEIDYVNGKKHGKAIYYDSVTGKKEMEGYFRNGVHDKKWIYYYEGTNIVQSEKNYNGDSTYVELKTNSKGKTYEDRYTLGRKHGEQKKYFADGKLRVIENFKNGILYGVCQSFDSLTGNILTEAYMQDGKLHGMKKVNFSNGTPRILLNYKNGMRDSVSVYYYESGNPHLIIEYKNDTLNGRLETFFASGKKMRAERYENGKLVEGHCYNSEGHEIRYTSLKTAATFKGDAMTYIGNHLKYPADALAEKKEGKVKIGFKINRDGIVSDVEILESLHPSCDEEAKRLIATMPAWTPMMIDGTAFESYHTLPIVFWIP